MLIILVPLIPFIAAVLLMQCNRDPIRYRLPVVIGTVSCSLTIAGILWLTLNIGARGETLFSSLFMLPGTREALSISLIVDQIALRWLIIVSITLLLCQLLSLYYLIHRPAPQLPTSPFPHFPISLSPHNTAALFLAQAGLNTLFLAGSLVTVLIGWGITAAAVVLSTVDQTPTRNTYRQSGFMTLFLAVFFLLSALFLLYATTGHLAFAHDPDTLAPLLSSLTHGVHGPLVKSILNITALLLLLGVLPGMGLFPITGWMEDTRYIHPINALMIFTAIMPAGIILLQRYDWFFSLTPGIRTLSLVIGMMSLLLAGVACLTLQGSALSFPWLAVTASSLLMITFARDIPDGIPFLLVTIYPGFLLTGIGRIVSRDFYASWGRHLSIAGLLFPLIATIAIQTIPAITPAVPVDPRIAALLVLAYLVPATRICWRIPRRGPETAGVTSSVGWLAYASYSLPTLLYAGLVWPIQQISDGFSTLETTYNQFWNHGLGRLVIRWAQLMNVFDGWLISRTVRHTRMKAGKE